MSDVIAAIASGRQPAAIGILRLSGEGCAAVAGKVFVPLGGMELAALPERRLCLGRLLDARGRVIDQAQAVVCLAPHSYTGEDTVELQCHGSPAVLTAGLEALFCAGARQAKPGEFTRRAFLNGKLDLTAAEAVVDLIDAQTADLAANAAAQVGGSLHRRLRPIYEGLTDVCSHYHAVLDYPDEDIPDFRLADFAEALRGWTAELDRLHATCDRGRILKQGVRIALIGRPNAGKSSLLNALVGFDRAIVTEIPGTTRDTVEEKIRLGSLVLRLIDTAGIRDTGDLVERIGVDRALEAAKDADLALLVIDGSAPLTEEDRRAMEAANTARHCVCILSKSDLGLTLDPETLDFDTVLPVSAVTGAGLEALAPVVEGLFASDAPCDGTLLTNLRHETAIRQARDAIVRSMESMDSGATPDAVLLDVEEALEAIAGLTGQSMREDITNDIFSRFCVGK